MKTSVFGLLCIWNLLFSHVLSYPRVGTLTSMVEMRQEEQHPMDLYNAQKLRLAMFEENVGFSIVVNQTEVSGTGKDWVTVSWKGVKDPKETDAVALFIAADDWTKKVPIKSHYAVESMKHLKQGRGIFQVRILNYRADVKFVMIRGFPSTPVVLGESQVIRINDKDTPLGVHLALTHRRSEMRIQWISATDEKPIVKWGPVSGVYARNATGHSVTYTPEDLCASPATDRGYIFPGYFHSVILRWLQPGKTYYYIFGNEVSGYSKEHSFKAPPMVGTDETVKIIGLADLGNYNVDYFDTVKGYEHSLDTTRSINKEEDVDLIVHVGDISYAQGYAADWDVFFDQIQPLASKAAYMVVQGNHERMTPGSGDRYNVSNDSGGECGVATARRMQMPHPWRKQLFYSFDFASIHFTMFCTELPFEPGTVQYKFLEDDLSSVDRELTPWVVVGFHRPMYLGITKDGPPNGYWYVSQELQENLAHLFNEKKVDWLWSGHHHSYQRTCPVDHEICKGFNPQTGEALAPIQLVFAHSGARHYTNLVKRSFIEYQEASMFGYVRFYVNRTHFKVESVANNIGVIDSFTLLKDTA